MNMTQAIATMGSIHFSSPEHAKLYVKSVNAFGKNNFLVLPNTEGKCEAATYIAANWDDYESLRQPSKKRNRK